MEGGKRWLLSKLTFKNSICEIETYIYFALQKLNADSLRAPFMSMAH